MSELAGLGLRADFSHRRVYAGGAENYIGEKGKPRVQRSRPRTAKLSIGCDGFLRPFIS